MEPLGDDLSHAVVRHELVGAFWIERADLLVGHAMNGGRRHACCGRRRRFGHRRHRRSRSPRPNALAGFCRFDVGRDDAPMRARAKDAGEVDAGPSRPAAAPTARKSPGLYRRLGPSAGASGAGFSAMGRSDELWAGSGALRITSSCWGEVD